ncbi:MAG: DUF1573 domain-containing protein [Pirellulaceae bacterium]|jgi:hypothetical protein|nr:DUF1573 domain-containing protein [Pirellulaceae bacterium]HJN07206.1 DUF1573 domain-containing protein [Pirellulaceae bacterium]
MRTSWIVIATAALGCLIGLGLTCYETVRVGDRFEASYTDQDPNGSLQVPAVTPRAVVVGESTFDFGTLEKKQTGTCTFKIRNESVAPLTVDLEGVSCGLCITTELEQTDVPSGEEFEFKVNYTTHKDGPEFAEHVEMRTSDPENLVIRFTITGFVGQSIRFSRQEISLGSIAAGEDVSTDFRIYGYDDDPIEIVAQEFITKESAEHFSLELTPLELDEFKDEEPRAKSAVQARLTMTRGRPLGPVRQVLRTTAQMGDKSAAAEIVIQAIVVSDIVLIGGNNFNKESSLVQFRSILSTVDHSTTLQIRIRGPYRDDVKLSVGTIDPANVLTATIGEPTILGSGYLYPLTITIPKGAPPVNRLGSQQGKVGVVNIETTHPSAKQLPIYVSFAIE